MGGDAIKGLVQAGAASGGSPTYTGRDNAYMLTLDDGIPPWSGMFLWEPINDAFEGPYRDGSLDMTVIQHEYSHGLSNRYVAGGSALGSQQAGSMGEGWGDWYALNHAFRTGWRARVRWSALTPPATTCAASATTTTTRTPTPSGHRLRPHRAGGARGRRDLDGDAVGPQQGARREVRAGQGLGGRCPPRDRRHAADRPGPVVPRRPRRDPHSRPRPLPRRRHRPHLVGLRQAGAGASAVSRTGDDTDPTPAFDHPAQGRNGTAALTLVNASTGQRIPNAKVILGRFEARVTPLGRTGSGGGFSVKAVAGTYPLTIQAPGFGTQTIEGFTIAAGQNAYRTISLAPNLASTAAGASVVSASSQDDGSPAKFAFDDTAASVWSTKPGTTAYNDGPDQRVTVKLAAPATVSSLRVSAYKATNASRFAALRDFTFQTSTDGVTWTTVRTGGFGYQAPRPTAADLNYRSFDLTKPVRAAYVRFFIDSVQGDTADYAQVADIQVFGSGATVANGSVTPDPDYTDSGTITAPNPAAGDATGLSNVFGVTGTEMNTACTFPPATQGADAWVTKFPLGFSDGLHSVSVKGTSDDTVGHDLDLYFLDSACQLTGSSATSAMDESAVIPPGSVYLLTQLWTGANVKVDVTAVDNR